MLSVGVLSWSLALLPVKNFEFTGGFCGLETFDCIWVYFSRYTDLFLCKYFVIALHKQKRNERELYIVYNVSDMSTDANSMHYGCEVRLIQDLLTAQNIMARSVICIRN